MTLSSLALPTIPQTTPQPPALGRRPDAAAAAVKFEATMVTELLRPMLSSLSGLGSLGGGQPTMAPLIEHAVGEAIAATLTARDPFGLAAKILTQQEQRDGHAAEPGRSPALAATSAPLDAPSPKLRHRLPPGRRGAGGSRGVQRIGLGAGPSVAGAD
jgi:Rod binding domain-containing protein